MVGKLCDWLVFVWLVVLVGWFLGWLVVCLFDLFVGWLNCVYAVYESIQ